jgi:hypothetical protein
MPVRFRARQRIETGSLVTVTGLKADADFLLAKRHDCQFMI